MKDWRGVAINEGDQVLWVSHVYSGHEWHPRIGKVSKLDEDKQMVTVKRAISEEEIRPWRKPSGVSVLPSHRVTRIDTLPDGEGTD